MLAISPSIFVNLLTSYFSSQPTGIKAVQTSLYQGTPPSINFIFLQIHILSSASSNGSDNTGILIAIISFMGVLITALSAIIVAFINGKLPIYLEQKKARKEHEQESKERDLELARKAMERARTVKQRSQIYRSAIQADPRIATLQILDMNRPLDVTNVFVHLRLNQESHLSYKIYRDSLDAERRRDPNAILQADQRRLDELNRAAIDPTTAIERYKRCVIVGDPGAGKSTLLKYLALKSAEGHLNRLPISPILIELNAFATSNYDDLLDYASSQWETRYHFPKAEAIVYMTEQLSKGQILVLLDALDETIIGKTQEESEQSYNHVLSAIINLATKFYKTPIVVTARKAGYYQRPRLTGFTELEVLDFRPEDIESFVMKWFEFHPILEKRSNAEDLILRLKRDPRLHTLTANPLLLSLTTIVYEAQLDLPDRRSELYKQCVDILLTKWDASRNIYRRREFKPEHKRQLLQEIAWRFHLQGRRYFPEDELVSMIGNFLPAIGILKEQSREILAEIATENGLIKEQARGWHGFLHLTLQEYFVAQYASDHDQLNAIVQYRHHPWWEEVILLYAGCTPDASPLFECLLESYNHNGLNFREWRKSDIILAGNCLMARPTIRKALVRQTTLNILLYIMVKADFHQSCREYIADIIIETGIKDVYALMKQKIFLNQIPITISLWYIDALGRNNVHFAIPDLLQMISSEQINPRIRQSAIYALSKIDDPLIKIELWKLLFDIKIELSISRHIYRVLGNFEGLNFISSLRQICADPQLDSALRVHLTQMLTMSWNDLNKSTTLNGGI